MQHWIHQMKTVYPTENYPPLPAVQHPTFLNSTIAVHHSHRPCTHHCCPHSHRSTHRHGQTLPLPQTCREDVLDCSCCNRSGTHMCLGTMARCPHSILRCMGTSQSARISVETSFECYCEGRQSEGGRRFPPVAPPLAQARCLKSVAEPLLHSQLHRLKGMNQQGDARSQRD